MQSDTGDVASGLRRDNVFKSCLELHEFAQQAGNADLEGVGSPLEVQNSAEESNANCSVADENEQENIEHPRSIDELSPLSGPTSSVENGCPKLELGVQEVEKKASGDVDTGSGSHSVTNETEWNDKHIGKSVLNDGADNSQQSPALEDANNQCEEIEPQTATSNEGDRSHSGLSKNSSFSFIVIVQLLLDISGCLFTSIHLKICRI